MKIKTNYGRAALLAMLMASASGTTTAIEVGDQFEVHGYGDLSQTAARVDASGQGLGAHVTTYNLSLVGTWRATDRTQLWVQLGLNEELKRPNIDWAFIDYQAASGQTYRLGRIRVPVGMHNELRDVQALRPSAGLPLIYLENLSLIDESADGGMVTQKLSLGDSRLSIDAFAATAMHSDDAEAARGSAWGARAMIETPINGLTLSGSGYRGKLALGGASGRRTKKGWVLSAHFANEQIDLQAEVARGHVYDHGVSAWYVQAALPLAESWHVTARFEGMVTDVAERKDDAYREERGTVGLAYSINRNFGLRLEQRLHRGYASAVADGRLAAGLGRHRWTSTVLGVNFKF